jgi:hypothetical protein
MIFDDHAVMRFGTGHVPSYGLNPLPARQMLGDPVHAEIFRPEHETSSNSR